MTASMTASKVSGSAITVPIVVGRVTHRPLRFRRFLSRAVASGRAPPEEERRTIVAGIFSDGPGELAPYVFRLTTLTALSTVIAAFGLIANSAAVVIGAMLVAPLMQPIIGLAAALVLGQPRREFTSLALIVLTTAEAFVVALLAGLAVPSFRVITLTPELLARTAPALLDLAIAVAAGAAGAYVTVRPRAGGAIAGVAIAVALVPPLSACGILLAHGNGGLASGAFFLFLTNLVGIVLSAVVVLPCDRIRRSDSHKSDENGRPRDSADRRARNRVSPRPPEPAHLPALE